MNKKGIILTAGLIASLIAGLVLLIVLSTAVIGTGDGDVTSTTKVKDGCEPELSNVVIIGDIKIEDTAWLGLKAEITELNVNKVKSVKFGDLFSLIPLRAWISEQAYEWEVCFIDSFTGNKECDTGKGSLSGSEDLGVRKSYSIPFTISDNDCNDVIDDFTAKLKATVTTDDNEVSEISKNIEMSNGKFKLMD